MSSSTSSLWLRLSCFCLGEPGLSALMLSRCPAVESCPEISLDSWEGVLGV